MPNGEFNQFKQFCESWLDILNRSAAIFGSVNPCEPPTEAARQIRSAVFKSMAEQVDKFMRSETFLQGMKQSLDTALEFQKQCQSVLTEVRHSTQGVATADVNATMMMLRQIESRLIDRLDDLDANVRQLSQRLDQMEAGKDKAGSPT
jgi:hypothetical protein